MCSGVTTLILVIGVSLPAAGAAKDLAEVIVEAGRRDRLDVTVAAPASPKEVFGRELPATQLAARRLILVEADGQDAGKSIPAQWQVATDPPMDGRAGGALVFTLPGKTTAKSVRRFRLQSVADGPAAAGVKVEDDEGKALLLRRSGRPIARYNYGLVQKQPGTPSVYDRTAYFHPVWAPCGQIITDDFPKSHLHQRGLFLAWTKAKIGDYKDADFWNLGDRRGETRHKRLDHVVSGPVFGGFVAYNECVADNRVAIKETWVTRVYAQPAGPWVIDVEVRHTATEKAVALQRYAYGGMAFRGRADWDRRKRPRIEASDGYNVKKGFTENARWVDMAGDLPGGKTGGLTMLDHPSNPTYPTAARIHPKEPYFCLAFTRRAPYTIEAGTSLELRYRCVVHDGPPDREANDRWSADFADPPKVTIKPPPPGQQARLGR